MGARAWTAEEDAALRRYYWTRPTRWPGWDEVLPGRTVAARRERAYRIGVYGYRRPPKRQLDPGRPSTCGACRFYLDNERVGVGRCMERHARTLFGGAPTVKADYPTTTCEWGEERA